MGPEHILSPVSGSGIHFWKYYRNFLKVGAAQVGTIMARHLLEMDPLRSHAGIARFVYEP